MCLTFVEFPFFFFFYLFLLIDFGRTKRPHVTILGLQPIISLYFIFVLSLFAVSLHRSLLSARTRSAFVWVVYRTTHLFRKPNKIKKKKKIRAYQSHGVCVCCRRCLLAQDTESCQMTAMSCGKEIQRKKKYNKIRNINRNQRTKKEMKKKKIAENKSAKLRAVNAQRQRRWMTTADFYIHIFTITMWLLVLLLYGHMMRVAWHLYATYVYLSLCSRDIAFNSHKTNPTE